MSKQSLLEEFDKMFISDNYSYSTGNFNSSDPVVNKLKQFISKAIDQTREESLAVPYDVSEWKNIGIERGYWDYFKKEVAKDVMQTMLDYAN